MKNKANNKENRNNNNKMTPTTKWPRFHPSLWQQTITITITIRTTPDNLVDWVLHTLKPTFRDAPTCRTSPTSLRRRRCRPNPLSRSRRTNSNITTLRSTSDSVRDSCTSRALYRERRCISKRLRRLPAYPTTPPTRITRTDKRRCTCRRRCRR